MLFQFRAAVQIQEALVALLAPIKRGIINRIIVRTVNAAARDVGVERGERVSRSQPDFIREACVTESVRAEQISINAVLLRDIPIHRAPGRAAGQFTRASVNVPRVVVVGKLSARADTELSSADPVFSIDLENVALFIDIQEGRNDVSLAQAAGARRITPRG
jgi:hypothetical protein